MLSLSDDARRNVLGPEAKSFHSPPDPRIVFDVYEAADLVRQKVRFHSAASYLKIHLTQLGL